MILNSSMEQNLPTNTAEYHFVFTHCNRVQIACGVIHIRKFPGRLFFQFSVRSGWIAIIKVPFQARTSYPCNNIPILRRIFSRFHVGH